MESLKISELLSKFSHCSTIIQYFGSYSHSQSLLSLFSKETRDMWVLNKYAFRIFFHTNKKIMEFHSSFNEEFADFLIAEYRYIKYKPKIRLSTADKINLFCTFIERVEYPDKLQFEHIEIKCKKKSPGVEILNAPFQALKAKNIDTSCIEIILPELFEDEKYEGALEYTKELTPTMIERAKYFKAIGKLDFDIVDNLIIEQFQKYHIFVSEISISPSIYKNLLSNSDKDEFSKSLLEGIKKINIIRFSNSVLGALNVFTIEEAKNIFPNIESISLDATLSRELVSPNILFTDILTNGVSYTTHSKSTLKKNKIKMKLHEPLTIENVNVFYYDSNLDKTTAFHVEKLLQYNPNPDCFPATSSKFFTLGTYRDCDYIEVSNIDNIDLTDFKNYLRINPVIAESSLAQLVVQKVKFSKINDIDSILKIKPKQCEEISLKLDNRSKDKNLLKAIRFISEIDLINNLKISFGLQKETVEKLSKLLKLNITCLYLSFRNSDLSKIDRKVRKNISDTITSMKSLRSCTLVISDLDANISTRNMTENNKRNLPNILTSLITRAQKKLPKTDFIDHLTIR
mmetsp:Transcript_31967/g.28329  ORF Transcript_31967/g.28329 Transcript_31967/m.28329 type:complete len:572 (+) Transcript_31967:18-1733(+)